MILVVFADVDLFKEVNDEYGHDVGDAVLKRVASALLDARCTDDLVARLGVDECCVVAWADGVVDRGAFADRFHAAVRAGLERQHPPVSVSLGLARPGTASAITDLRAPADAAMHAAKRAGGGRFELAPEAPNGARGRSEGWKGGQERGMSLTVGTAPFGPHRAGRFDFEPPHRAVFVEPFPRRVRAVLGGDTVVDSDAVLLVHETGQLPHYAFPAGDVSIDAEPEVHAGGHVTVPWDGVDAWFEEDERVEVHPRDPYHRIDTFGTSRRVEVSLDGTLLAASTRARALYETSLPVRWYLPAADVRTELLSPSSTVTECAYKGTARHWHTRLGDRVVEDVAWTYDEVRREGEPVRGLIAFYNERVDLDVDGVRHERPITQWSERDEACAPHRQPAVHR